MSDEQQPVNQDSIERDRLVDSICVTFEKMYFGERFDLPPPTRYSIIMMLIKRPQVNWRRSIPAVSQAKLAIGNSSGISATMNY
jgi:hypothetical protein